MNELPDGFALVEDVLSLKRLINERIRKNRYADSNLEPIPQHVYVYSPHSKQYSKKYYWKGAPEEKIIDLIKRKLLYAKLEQFEE